MDQWRSVPKEDHWLSHFSTLVKSHRETRRNPGVYDLVSMIALASLSEHLYRVSDRTDLASG